MAENYQGGGFEVTIRCTGGISPRKKHRRDFGRIVFTTSPFTDSPFGETVRESWAVDGGWIGLLGIEMGRHKDGSFRAANKPKIEIYPDNGIQVRVRCQGYGCRQNPVFNLDTLGRIMADLVRDGNHVFDISLPPK